MTAVNVPAFHGGNIEVRIDEGTNPKRSLVITFDGRARSFTPEDAERIGQAIVDAARRMRESAPKSSRRRGRRHAAVTPRAAAPEQILARIDRALAELRELRVAVAGPTSDELTPDEIAELRERARLRAARMRAGRTP